MPEPEKRDDYARNPNLRIGFLYTNYAREDVRVPDQSSTNKPKTLAAYRKKGVSDVTIPSAFLPRSDYGDLSSSHKFQAEFRTSFDKYFGIKATDMPQIAQQKLASAGIEVDPRITNRIVADAKFNDLDRLGFEFQKQGLDVDVDMSHNDVEKMFNFLCYTVLSEQDDEEAKVGNIARSWSPLKAALRIWFRHVFGENYNLYYRTFIADLDKGPASKFRPAITSALKQYRPVLGALLAERAARHAKLNALTFTIQSEYYYTDDYEELPQRRCVLDKFFLRKDYLGREGEIAFAKYFDNRKDAIEWWFKNGDSGKESLGIKYQNTSRSCEALFYPDWIVKFLDGRVGIFDTKSGRTATDTEGRAEALAAWLGERGKQFVGGIVVFEDGVWRYNDSVHYEYIKGKLGKSWKYLEELLTEIAALPKAK